VGTYQLLTLLWRHWSHPVNPVYRNDGRYGPPWRALPVGRWLARLLRIGVIAAVIVIVAALVRVVAEQQILWAVSTLLIQTACLSSGFVLLVGLCALTFLWPIAVAVTASGTIVRERERRTWAALLTIPYDWNDLLVAKLASALRWLNRPTELLIWVQGLLTVIVFILVISQTERLSEAIPAGLVVVLMVLASLQFAVGRVQDYTTAGILGLAASIISETRQAALVFSLLAGTGMVIVRILFTALLLVAAQINPPPPPQGVLILLATGPTTVLIMALVRSPLLAMVLLVGFPLLRELIIRTGYGWVLRHLGLAAGNG
jgi:hypothetical protein